MINYSFLIVLGNKTSITRGLFNAKTTNIAWDIFRHDFQSCGRTMERKSLLFHVKS